MGQQTVQLGNGSIHWNLHALYPSETTTLYDTSTTDTETDLNTWDVPARAWHKEWGEGAAIIYISTKLVLCHLLAAYVFCFDGSQFGRRH